MNTRPQVLHHHVTQKIFPYFYPQLSQLLCIALCLFCMSTPSLAEKKNSSWNEFLHSDDQFSVQFPPELKAIRPQNSPARLVLIPNEGKYPSGNVLIFPGKYPLEASLNALKSRLTHEYQQAGLQDASVKFMEKQKRTDGVDFLFAQMSYTKTRIPHLSSLAIFSAEQKHYVVTCILPESSSAMERKTCTRLVSSLQSPLLRRNALENNNTAPPFLAFYITLGTLLFIVLCIGFKNHVSKQ